MKIYDISVGLTQTTPVFPGDPRFQSRLMKSLSRGDVYELHEITLGNHTGTHVDAPAHFVKDGLTVAELPLELLNGHARVIEIQSNESIDTPELRQLSLAGDLRVLFKTRNSISWNRDNFFHYDYVYLAEAAARHLCDSGVKLVGFDYLSIDRYGDNDFPAHKILLQNQVIIVEGLNLSEVPEGEYEMNCLPLRLLGLDAAPARVILKK